MRCLTNTKRARGLCLPLHFQLPTRRLGLALRLWRTVAVLCLSDGQARFACVCVYTCVCCLCMLFDIGKPSDTRPLLFVAGERWSRSPHAPCYDHGKDIVVPTPNAMLPSVDGHRLLAASSKAADSDRPVCSRDAVRSGSAHMRTQSLFAGSAVRKGGAWGGHCPARSKAMPKSCPLKNRTNVRPCLLGLLARLGRAGS